MMLSNLSQNSLYKELYNYFKCNQPKFKKTLRAFQEETGAKFINVESSSDNNRGKSSLKSRFIKTLNCVEEMNTTIDNLDSNSSDREYRTRRKTTINSKQPESEFPFDRTEVKRRQKIEKNGKQKQENYEIESKKGVKRRMNQVHDSDQETDCILTTIKYNLSAQDDQQISRRRRRLIQSRKLPQPEYLALDYLKKMRLWIGGLAGEPPHAEINCKYDEAQSIPYFPIDLMGTKWSEQQRTFQKKFKSKELYEHLFWRDVSTGIYMEHQQGNLCSLHAVNMLIGDESYTATPMMLDLVNYELAKRKLCSSISPEAHMDQEVVVALARNLGIYLVSVALDTLVFPLKMIEYLMKRERLILAEPPTNERGGHFVTIYYLSCNTVKHYCSGDSSSGWYTVDSLAGVPILYDSLPSLLRARCPNSFSKSTKNRISTMPCLLIPCSPSDIALNPYKLPWPVGMKSLEDYANEEKVEPKWLSSLEFDWHLILADRFATSLNGLRVSQVISLLKKKISALDLSIQKQNMTDWRDHYNSGRIVPVDSLLSGPHGSIISIEMLGEPKTLRMSHVLVVIHRWLDNPILCHQVWRRILLEEEITEEYAKSLKKKLNRNVETETKMFTRILKKMTLLCLDKFAGYVETDWEALLPAQVNNIRITIEDVFRQFIYSKCGLSKNQVVF